MIILLGKYHVNGRNVNHFIDLVKMFQILQKTKAENLFLCQSIYSLHFYSRINIPFLFLLPIFFMLVIHVHVSS